MICPTNTQNLSQSQTQSKLDMMPESDITTSIIPAYLNYNHVEKVDVDVAQTIGCWVAKGYGTGTQTTNGVIECNLLQQ